MSYTHEVSDLPSLAALEAFEASARHRSFTKAAQELHLTQGAISRAVSSLEAQLGVNLFARVRQRIQLTPGGEAYLSKVRPALQRLAAATLELKAFKGAGGVLNLAILPTFGTKWLIPRMTAFTTAHPEVLVNFTTRIYAFDFETEELDAAIHLGEGRWPGARLDHLLDEEVMVVCSPTLIPRLHRPEDLNDQVLLQMASRPQGWEEWLAAKGMKGIDGRRGPRFEHHAMVLEAAMAGLGLAVLPTFLVQEELNQGRVVEAFHGTKVPSGKAYWLAYPERNGELPALAAFRRWLLAEIQR